MPRYFKKRKPSPTELTWEEKNPTDYLYYSSEAIDRLREMVKRNEKGSSISSVHKRKESQKK